MLAKVEDDGKRVAADASGCYLVPVCGAKFTNCNGFGELALRADDGCRIVWFDKNSLYIVWNHILVADFLCRYVSFIIRKIWFSGQTGNASIFLFN